MFNRLFTAVVVLGTPFCLLQSQGLFAPLHERPFWLVAAIALPVLRYVVRFPATAP